MLDFALWLFAGSVGAGLLGALTGLGGGVIIVPMLVLGFGVDVRYAVGASLVSIIATSSGAAAAYIKEGYTNIRLGTFLGVATSLGAFAGAWAASRISAGMIAVVFGVTVLYTALVSIRPPRHAPPDPSPDSLAARLELASTYPGDAGRPVAYTAHRVPAGFGLMTLGGVLASLAGIGGGVVNVVVMDRVMHIPFKVCTTTSNFMIGVTAAAGAGVYLARGQVDPALCFPIILGTTAGSLAGARLLARVHTALLRKGFAVVIAIVGVQMIYRGLSTP